MGIFDGVLLASDFDNTLLNTEVPRRTGAPVPRLSAGNRAALEYFMAQGGRFALATGRALAAIEKLVDDIPTNSPAVICNGAAMYDFQAREYLDIIMLDEVVSQRCQEVLERFPTTAVEAYPLKNVIHAVRPNLYTRQHEHVTHVAVHEDASIMDIPRPMTKLMFEDCHETLLDIRAFLLSQPWIGGYEVFFSDQTLLEMTARGANKGGMVARLAQRLGIESSHVYCVGDEANDLSMLVIAAEGFAPANCVEAVRQSGATVVADCDHDALADVVARLEQKYR